MNTNDWNNNPAQKVLWNKVQPLLVGVQTIVPVHYQGVLNGSEYGTYSVKKLYVALECKFSGDFTLRTSAAAFRIYNEANGIVFSGYNYAYFWDATAAAYKIMNMPFTYHNFYFSRMDATALYYDSICFTGYKITIP